MIYYTISKNKDVSGKHYHSLDLFSSRKAVLLFAENHRNVVSAGSIDLERKVEYCSGWKPELGDSLEALRSWSMRDTKKPLIVTEPDGSQWVSLEDYLALANL